MKKALSLIMFFCLAFSAFTIASAETVEEKAKVLFDLGLLKGTQTEFSTESLELDRNATRAEICTTIVRMLGKEEKSHYQQNPHPFNDVPDWASEYVGWLYENYLVNGVSDTYFGAEDIATVQQFSTMLLRVLGYDDSQGDFSYVNSVAFSKSKALLDAEIASHYELSRSDMISMCYNALRLNIKNSNRTLARKLCDEGSLNESLAKELGVLDGVTLSDSFPEVEENLGNITVSQSQGQFTIHLSAPLEHYGVRIFIKENNSSAIQEIKSSGNVYFQKGNIEYINGSAAGYISELYVYGLDASKKYSFIVVKTTSEGELYYITGKSSVAEN